MEKIRVLVYEPGKDPEERKIKNTLKTLQAIVNGHIQAVRISEDLYLVCNDEGKLLNLAPNKFMNNDIIAGNFIVAADDRENEDFKSLSDNQINYAKSIIAMQNSSPELLQFCASLMYYKEEL